MANNPNEVNNFEQLMRKYLKNNEDLINKYDYQSPLKEITKVEPLIFQNEILPMNNNPNNIPDFDYIYNNGINNNIQNNINIRNDLNNNINNININNINDNKFITPSKPNNKNSSDINSFIVSSIEREKAMKEEKKKKQLEYQKMLDEQIKEKKIRQKKEKEKRMQEELLFEEKLRLENEKYEEEQKKNKMMNKFRNNNLFSEDEKIPISQKNLIFEKNNNNLNENINLENNIEENTQNEIINHEMKRAKSQQYLEIMNNNNLFQQNQKYIMGPAPQYIGGGGGGEESQENPLFQNPNLNQNLPQNQIPIEHLVSTSSQINSKLLNPLNPKHPQYKTQNNYYPSNRHNPNQTQNIFQNSNNINYPLPPKADISPYMTQRQYYDYREKLHRVPSDLGSNTNISINHSNFPTCYQIPFNNNLINSSPNPVNFNNNSQNVNEFINMNSQNYFGKIMEIFFNEQKKILDSYKETIEKLKSERDEAIYRNKANEEKILALQKMQNDQEILEKNLGYFPFKNNYQQNMEKTLDSIMQKNEDFNESNENKGGVDENKKSLNNMNNITNNISNISDSKLASLITSTKFVKVNNNGGDKELLETWKKEDKDDNINNENNLNKDSVKNKNKLNGMDTNAFMEKINLINNKILEPPDEPQNYLNDNNISIISKTQKNDDKSFANELSNRNDKDDIDNTNNINDDENKKYSINDFSKEISKNENYKFNSVIRDSDLSAQKFVVELQSKDFVLNNVHNPIMQNLDNNVSYSTQIKERLEEKRKQLVKNNKKDEIDIISEKESGLSRNFEDEKKNKYQNYAFKQIKCSKNENLISSDINENIESKNIKMNQELKNIDNNLTVSKSKNNYSMFISKHLNNNNEKKENENENEKNPFGNVVSINDTEENNLNNNMKNKNIYIEDKSQEIEEEINDIPNLDSPKNNNKIMEQYDLNINKDGKNDNNNFNSNSNININNVEIKKNDEIMEKLNFFEDDNISSKIKIDKNLPANKFNNINININADINDSFLKDNSNIINNKTKNDNANCNTINDNNNIIISNRPKNDISKDKISSLNDLYDQYMKKKKNKLNETNNSIVNNNNNNLDNNSLLNESLNTFTQNLNIKWKDLTKKDINNINREHHDNYDNNYENNMNCLEDDRLEDEKIFDKVNQFTRVALNELKQSQLSVFSKDKTIKKYE